MSLRERFKSKVQQWEAERIPEEGFKVWETPEEFYAYLDEDADKSVPFVELKQKEKQGIGERVLIAAAVNPES